jgi:hypothetical protein
MKLSVLVVVVASAYAKLSLTPPMGWMSWEIFRCEIDCTAYPNSCINNNLYETTVDVMVQGGYLAAGYDTIHTGKSWSSIFPSAAAQPCHLDDCWETKQPARDPSTSRLVANSTRFPNGMKAVVDYTHSKGVRTLCNRPYESFDTIVVSTR